MLFNTIEYFIFLPLVVFCYFVLPFRYRWILLLTASYFFYMHWMPVYAIFMLMATTINYWASIKISQHKEHAGKKKYLIISLAGTLGILFFFKYLSFFNEVIRESFSLFGLSYSIPGFNILLPIGISFYTFQALSYTLDVYWGKIGPEKHFGIFALYISFFPQLVAGPIERAARLIPQFTKKMFINWQNVVGGSKIILWGLFKKIIIADNLKIFIDYVFANPSDYSGNIISLAGLAFAMEIYCDFSGYADIAIGSAQLLGFTLTDNFNRPNFSVSIPNLWQRWHISFTSWIYDYLGKPLNEISKNRYLNIYILLIAIGLWHGASWNFIAFGLVHATYIAVHRLTERYRKKLVYATGLNHVPLLKKNIDIAITFSLWVFSGFFFRCENMSDSLYMITHFFTGGDIGYFIREMPALRFSKLFIVATSISLLFFIEISNTNDIRNPFNHIRPDWLRWLIYLMVVFYLIVFGENLNEPFYYFQF